MDIKGTEIKFTPSEAHWAQSTSVLLKYMPGLVQRIQDARVARLSQWLDGDKLPPPVARPSQGAITIARYLSALNGLLEVELKHSIDERGQEQPVVAVQVSRDEKQGLLWAAEIDYELAQEELTIPEIVEIEDQAIRDDFAMGAATSNFMKPDQAVALGDILRDPEQLADHYAMQRNAAEKNVALLGPMILRLALDLS